ncbi:MAG TPA: alpha-E domain-containing protein [Cytophagales bacterium]|nr:alpha-E domain-containing protein [Cytophagales bacterium]
MLSRIANNLFWAGRYMERSEHMARYYLTHYYNVVEIGTQELQIQSYNSMFLLAGMSDIPSVDYIKSNESDVVSRLMLDRDNVSSLKSVIHQCRENMRSARDMINSNLWETTNKLYMLINNVRMDELEMASVSSLCERIVKEATVAKSYIDNSLIQNETWAFLKLGIHMEAACQVCRIITTKLTESDIYADTMNLDNTETYFSLNLLKNLEAQDMYKNHYKALPNLRQSLEFLILEKSFPKSISYNMEHIRCIVEKIADMNGISKNGLEYQVGKVSAGLKYTDVDVLQQDYVSFIENLLTDIHNIAHKLEERYFIY